MPLFGKKKGSEKNEIAGDEGLNLDDLSLENLDDDEDNEDSDIDDDDEEETAKILEQALGGMSDDSGDDGADEEGDEASESAEEDDGDGGLGKDLMDIFAGEEEVDSDLATLTHGLEDVEAASLLTQAQQIAEVFRRIRQS